MDGSRTHTVHFDLLEMKKTELKYHKLMGGKKLVVSELDNDNDTLDYQVENAKSMAIA